MIANDDENETNDLANDTENINISADNFDEPVNASIDPQDSQQLDDPLSGAAGFTEQSIEELVPKIESVLIVEPRPENATAIDELINESQEAIVVVDDMEIRYNPKKGFGLPLGVTNSMLVKRENDIVSGNIAFDVLVSIYFI